MTSSRDDWLPDAPSDVLALARERRAEADRAEADLMQLAVQWAIQHPAESVADAETLRFRGFGDTGVPVAGPGAPLVAEFSLAEFAATVGMSPEAGKRYVGQAVECRYRLKKTWAADPPGRCDPTSTVRTATTTSPTPRADPRVRASSPRCAVGTTG